MFMDGEDSSSTSPEPKNRINQSINSQSNNNSTRNYLTGDGGINSRNKGGI